MACRNFHSNDLSTLAKDKEAHIIDKCSATQQEMNEECRKDINVAANKRTYVLHPLVPKLMLSTHNINNRD